MGINILGAYQTKFGELWDKSLLDLIKEASFGALKDSRLKPNDLDAVFVGNMLSSRALNQGHLGALTTEILGINVPAVRVEAACASGGLALFNAINALLTGLYQTVLVLGVEKMTDLSAADVTSGLMEAGSYKKETKYGLTFPSLYALMARSYMDKYQLTEEELALVSVKNHYHASLNQKAQFPFEINVSQVLKSPKVADPLKLLDCSPITDGGAAIIISNSNPSTSLRMRNQKSKSNNKRISIAACEMATDTVALQDREDFTSLKATKIASLKAYQKAKIKPVDIDLAEVHDCFSIAEIFAYEDLGFCSKGKAKDLLKEKETWLNGRLPVNTSGGLKACGHPVGATGVKQICELYYQLSNFENERQVKNARVGLAQNVGGSGATSIISILTNQL